MPPPTQPFLLALVNGATHRQVYRIACALLRLRGLGISENTCHFRAERTISETIETNFGDEI